MKALRDWFRPPRHLLAIFLLITLTPLIVLLGIVGRWLEQERVGELATLAERRQQVTDIVVAGLQQRIAETERKLLTDSARLERSEHAATLRFHNNLVDGHILFYPVVRSLPEAPAETFVAAEKTEWSEQNRDQAAAQYRELARSTDEAVRGGALIRLARVLGAGEDRRGALRTYEEAAALDGAGVSGVPASLLARWAGCGLLEATKNVPELTRCGSELQSALLGNRWQLSRTTWEANFADAVRWSGRTDAGPTPSALEIAKAAEWLWEKSPALLRGGAGSGREVFGDGEHAVTVVWVRDGEALLALLADNDYVKQVWMSRVGAILDRERAIVAWGAEARLVGTNEVHRSELETGLPWPVMLKSVDSPAEVARIARKQQLWLGALATLAMLLVGGTWLIARAVMRELAVARLQSDFVAAVSHEFRTPLTSLRQVSEVLADGRVPNEERRSDYYAVLQRQTGRLQQLVESLLDFGRMEAGNSRRREETADLCAFVRRVVAQFEEEVRAQGFCVEVECSGSTTVKADIAALTTALWNLLDNAVKYSGTSREVRVGVRVENHRVAIFVRDAGIGIPLKEQREIFGKFVRGERAKADGIQGTGIGLAIVSHVAKEHGGKVRVESEPGKGSTFIVELPCHES